MLPQPTVPGWRVGCVCTEQAFDLARPPGHGTEERRARANDHHDREGFPMGRRADRREWTVAGSPKWMISAMIEVEVARTPADST